RRGPPREPRAADRPVRPDDRRVTVRDGRAHAYARQERDETLFRGLRRDGGGQMTLIEEVDRGTPARSGPATVDVTIDGRQVSVPEGSSVMPAASLAGIDIPKLCATDTLEAFGSCRMCLVEVEGGRGVPASCTTPCTSGMVVSTESDKLQKLRRGTM